MRRSRPREGWRQLRGHPHQPLPQPVHLHPRPPRPEHRQHRGLRLRRARDRRRHVGLRQQQRRHEGRDRARRAQALAIAAPTGNVNAEPVRLAPVEAYRHEWNTPVKKNPFDMPLQPKLDLLLQIHEEALKVPGASFVSAFMQFVNEQKYFASTEGSHIEQSLIRSYPSRSRSRRSTRRPASSTRAVADGADGHGLRVRRGYPLLEEARSRRRRSGGDAQGQAGAAGQKTLILHPTNLWLTIHESVGHPTGARSRARLRGELRRHQLPRPPTSSASSSSAAKHVNFVADKTQEKAMAPAATTTTA